MSDAVKESNFTASFVATTKVAKLNNVVILSRAFRRRTSRDISDLIAGCEALRRKTCSIGQSHTNGIHDLNIAGDPFGKLRAGSSRNIGAQDDSAWHEHGHESYSTLPANLV